MSMRRPGGKPALSEVDALDPNKAHAYAIALLARHDHSMRQLIVRLLNTVGHHVDVAEDGLLAWDALQQRHYDLLVTDCAMPRVSGVELVKKVRAARMALPVILVSGLMPTEELERLPVLRLAATLAKPFTGDELIATVGGALGTHPISRPPRFA